MAIIKIKNPTNSENCIRSGYDIENVLAGDGCDRHYGHHTTCFGVKY